MKDFVIGLLLASIVVGGAAGIALSNRITIRTDKLTGCQYVTVDGSITPRLDRTGKQICGKANHG